MNLLQEFPHPFSRIDARVGKKSNKSHKVINYLSYFAVAELVWLGASGTMHVSAVGGRSTARFLQPDSNP